MAAVTDSTSSANSAAADPAADDAPDIVAIEARLLRSEYEALEKAAKRAGMTPNDFLRRAIADEALLTEETDKGSQILIRTKWGEVKEVMA